MRRAYDFVKTKTLFGLKKLGRIVGYGLLGVYVVMSRPWRLLGYTPEDDTKRLWIPARVTIVPGLTYITLLLALNIAGMLLLSRYLPDSSAVPFFCGAFSAAITAGLDADFITPWWRRRYMRRVNAQHIIEIPDRALDTVFQFEPGKVRFQFSNEFKEWAKKNLKRKHGTVPMSSVDFHDRVVIPKVWFKDRDDAFAFKMRWL